MFPLQQSNDNELVFQIPCQLGEISRDNYDASPSLGTRKKRRVLLLGRNNCDEITAAADNEFKLKKIMHRDMERQRRQGMASLYPSLRSLLPLHYVKGKRSVSDHMHEAVKYIKQLQENMNELQRKRDNCKLKIVTEDGSSDNSINIVSQDCVTVNPCQGGGVEILINGSFAKGNLPLSRVIQELSKQGLDVVSCVSTTVNQNPLHKIHSEVCDMKCINLNALQKKVIDVINSHLLE